MKISIVGIVLFLCMYIWMFKIDAKNEQRNDKT